MGLAHDDVTGPEFGSHPEAALAIAVGAADTGLAVRAAAVDLDLDFLPVAWKDYDLVLAAEAPGAAAPLVEAVHDPAVHAAISALGGYDLRRAGSVDHLIEVANRYASTDAFSGVRAGVAAQRLHFGPELGAVE